MSNKGIDRVEKKKNNSDKYLFLGNNENNNEKNKVGTDVQNLHCRRNNMENISSAEEYQHGV